jgi:hypothetical protein
VTGYFISPSIIIGSDTMIDANNYPNMFLVKCNATGNALWANAYGGTASELGLSVSTDFSGNSYVTGYYDSPAVTFGSYTLSNAGNKDIFIMKSGPNGNVNWVLQGAGQGNDRGWSVAVNGNSDLFVFGDFGYQMQDTLTFGTTSLYPPAGSLDPMFIAKFDTTGVLLCSTTLPTGGTLGGGIAAGLHDHVFMAGGANQSPFIVGNDTLQGALGPYIFTVGWSCDVIDDVQAPDVITDAVDVFPNPFREELNVSIGENQDAEIILYDVLSHEVCRVKFHGSMTLPAEQLSRGIYLYEVQTADGKISRGKVIHQ